MKECNCGVFVFRALMLMADAVGVRDFLVHLGNAKVPGIKNKLFIGNYAQRCS